MLFPANSRYQSVEVAKLVMPDGTELVYLKRRFVPPPERLAPMADHVIVEGDRIDNIAARYLGDPEQYWRICDANRAMRPAELTEQIGRRLRITLPDGVPGASGV
jgi:nucleoid-associated protein YgaU